MPLPYRVTTRQPITFQGGHGQGITLSRTHFKDAIAKAHHTIDKIAEFEVDIFSILGMRNLSAFIGELYAASLISVTGIDFIKNPHQDGYPDLLLMDPHGKDLFQQFVNSGQIREKTPFSPFANGGLEVKATCGSVPTPDRCRRMGHLEKPDIGDQRIGLMTGYDWKAHHRDTNNLVGILWDFIDRVPRIVAVFFCSSLSQDHWGKIIQPKEGGGRTTSVSIMSREGVRKMYENWVVVLDNDPQYSAFLNRYNKGTLI